MKQCLKILDAVLKVSAVSDGYDDQWGFVKLFGSNSSFIPELASLHQILNGSGFTHSIGVSINSAVIDDDDLAVYTASPHKIKSWEISLNKLPLSGRVGTDGFHYNFFLSEATCQTWLTNINPLSKDCPFNSFPSNRIVINGLTDPFAGRVTQFLSNNETLNELVFVNRSNIPSWEQLRENIHFITTESININCKAFEISGKMKSTLEKIFMGKAAMVFATCLATEYYNEEKVIIDGIKRIVLSIGNEMPIITPGIYDQLLDLLNWIFEDRVSIRKKLFIDRLSLDLDPGESLLKALSVNLNSAFAQARERYNFVIIERKDAYIKELKELLKDIRTQSELYSGKIRTLLSNFLRDLLAAIVLIGFTIFTKFSDNASLANHDLLKYVFYGLAIYYIVSILMQTIIDVTDIEVSKKEILYWKNATKELLPEKEFKDHINSSLKGRRISLRLIYPLIAVCYLAIAFACYKYPEILARILHK